MKQGTSTVGILSALMLTASVTAFAATAAEAAPIPDCIREKVTFDGITPLTYATITVSAGARVELYRGYPRNACVHNDCAATTQLKDGDRVAIGKTCSDWTYVQHIGDKSVTEGWVRAERLKDLSFKLPYDDGEPGGRQRPPGLRAPSTLRVKLIQGTGIPVCMAYLQRLNQTVFHEPPYCGIPENNQVPGFDQLDRVPLSSAAVNRLFVQAYNVSHPTSTNGEMRPPGPERPGIVAVYWVNGQVSMAIPAAADTDHVSAWGFRPLVEIENDGKPDNVVIWRDYPPIWGKELNFPCGESMTSGMGNAPSDSNPFILTIDGQAIDVEKTIQVFGDPVVPPAYVAARSRPKGFDMDQEFIPLGQSISVFRFHKKFYFSAYRQLDAKRSTSPTAEAADQHLSVYLRETHQTKKMCEYQNANGYGWFL
jgi:hypothetical protein